MSPESGIQTEPSEIPSSFGLKGRLFSWLDKVRYPAVRLPVLLSLHLVLFSAIYAFAFFARFNFQPLDSHRQLFWSTLGPVVISKLAVFYFGSHFHGWWRYVTFADLKSLLKVTMVSMFVVAFVDYFLLPFAWAIPRLSILLDALATVVVIGGLRCTWRFVDEVFGIALPSRRKRSAILVGTDRSIGQLAAQINSNQSMPCRITALLAVEPGYRRRAVLGGVPVLGHLGELTEVAAKLGTKDVLVPAGVLDGLTLRQLTNQCNAVDLSIRVLPRFEDAMDGNEQIPLRPLNIEDLLRRDPIQLDTEEVENLLQGKRVLITGAGGSIGSEICRQTMRFGPSEVILLGRGENRIHAIHGELKAVAGELGITLHIEIGDITDQSRMQRLFETRRPQIIFHAAAHKHVPLMELHPGEAVKNNILGTRTIASLADRHDAEHFVMVSTDKAVNPTSIMGCSKYLAERIVYEFAQKSQAKFAVVRFGNVLGSAGSVIPIFQEQIRRGGPITITDERMTRYFMSIPEASQLVIQAAAQCRGGEIFVLDMGEPIRIVQLASDLVALSGLPKGSIEFVFTGVRPGEKLYEELYFDDETTIPTPHPKVRAAYASDFQDFSIQSGLDTLIKMSDAAPAEVRAAVTRLIPSYLPSHSLSTTGNDVKSLDRKSQEPAGTSI
ncbi:FlaA1/EpsC-like NDP-sugar epimerase [Rhodopirellula rubra]|uniref:FlaA1/EpsC-like NDP-sugar epimerase n=1 Tax=Aporhodopirellula rubra TaxID=980271 RepID=A0A7W5H7G6_9BACT|nr:nucleoside-diphosphate sugar epimerase/dehydratase [Aporhodopirellula rubra]MBB3208343.1 FlaA1/EpsC-like NDP-sugar epimerase [Aporhodopirellula rubra]